jgi:sugar phosphate isomerase/epimerase
MPPRIGAQTVTWKETLRDRMESVVRFLAGQGYEGVETGMRFFDPARAGEYRDLYAATGIYPLGLHSGGKFWDPAQTAEEMKRVGETIAFGSQVGFEFLVLSGNPGETPDSMRKTAQVYGDLAKRSMDAGLKFAYHHHNWELKNQGELLKILVGLTDSREVSLVLDMAWAHVAGWRLDGFLQEFGDRAAYLHLKDAAGGRFCELGTGEVDFELFSPSLDLYPIPWLVVEQDETTLTPEESLARNMRFLRSKGVA